MEEFYTLLYTVLFEDRFILVIIVLTIAFILCYCYANYSGKSFEDINSNKSTNKQSEVRVIINRRNGLKEYYIDEDNRFYTLNGKKITKPNINRMIYEDENYFFLLNCIKVYREVDYDDDFDRVWEEYYAYITLYDYNANEIFQKIIKIKFPKTYSDIDKEVLKEYNDNIKLFCNQYLYSKAGKKIIKLQGEEKISLEGENVIITLPDGEEIKFNSRLEQINLENGIIYVGKYL